MDHRQFCVAQKYVDLGSGILYKMGVKLDFGWLRKTCLLGSVVGYLSQGWGAAEVPQRATREDLWALAPLQVAGPQRQAREGNIIDLVLGRRYESLGLRPYDEAERTTLLRRVSYDLIGLPPTVEERRRFLADGSGSAYEALVDRLLENPQHGVRYARHWLDVLRYADVDEGMPAGATLYYWRDWIIRALNQNMPYDAFVRTQITGYEARERTSINALGYRRKLTIRPENLFALGFLSRGAQSSGDGEEALAMSAVETISTAFLGLTVHCAKCHDHFYDPIDQADYYRMKALFDPLKLRRLPLATATQMVDFGEATRAYEAVKARVDAAVAEIEAPYRRRLYDERVAMLTAEVQVIIRKPMVERSAEEQKIADDYFPVLRIDVSKIKEIMPEDVLLRYDTLRKEQSSVSKPKGLPYFLMVEADEKRRETIRYILNSGDAARPEKDKKVEPGFLFEPEGTEYRDGLRETFVDWMTGEDNALFARVAVNRIWQWHFGRGLNETANDFGSLASEPILRDVLDGLAHEFVVRGFDMKWLHKEIVMSAAYRRSSVGSQTAREHNSHHDAANENLWRYPLRRLEAEPIRDALLLLADRLDLAIGGVSYLTGDGLEEPQRRAVYLKRGFRAQENLLPEFLDAFDAEDGRESCARRETTVTAPQALWLMNNPLANEAAALFGRRLSEIVDGDLLAGIQEGYRMALTREPEPAEVQVALEYLESQTQAFERLAWMLVNLDEFIYLR